MATRDEKRSAGLRLVPREPDLKEFPVQAYACDYRPHRCDRCTMDACGYDVHPMLRGA